MRYLIEHETKLAFREPVREHHCELRLAPQESAHQKVARMRLEIEPDAELHSYTDCFGNRRSASASGSPPLCAPNRGSGTTSCIEAPPRPISPRSPCASRGRPSTARADR
jgi:hypothetical protein